MFWTFVSFSLVVTTGNEIENQESEHHHEQAENIDHIAFRDGCTRLIEFGTSKTVVIDQDPLHCLTYNSASPVIPAITVITANMKMNLPQNLWLKS